MEKNQNQSNSKETPQDNIIPCVIKIEDFETIVTVSEFLGIDPIIMISLYVRFFAQGLEPLYYILQLKKAYTFLSNLKEDPENIARINIGFTTPKFKEIVDFTLTDDELSGALEFAKTLYKYTEQKEEEDAPLIKPENGKISDLIDQILDSAKKEKEEKDKEEKDKEEKK